MNALSIIGVMEQLSHFCGRYNVPQSEIYINAGAALVLRGFRETTSDIDITIFNPKLYFRLKKIADKVMTYRNYQVLTFGKIEVFLSYKNKTAKECQFCLSRPVGQYVKLFNQYSGKSNLPQWWVLSVDGLKDQKYFLSRQPDRSREKVLADLEDIKTLIIRQPFSRQKGVKMTTYLDDIICKHVYKVAVVYGDQDSVVIDFICGAKLTITGSPNTTKGNIHDILGMFNLLFFRLLVTAYATPAILKHLPSCKNSIKKSIY